MLRIRFRANGEDPRPVIWPIKHPYWVSGSDALGTFSVLVAYADNEDYIYRHWPEATELEVTEVSGYKFTSRFSKPDWWTPEVNDAN